MHGSLLTFSKSKVMIFDNVEPQGPDTIFPNIGLFFSGVFVSFKKTILAVELLGLKT